MTPIPHVFSKNEGFSPCFSDMIASKGVIIPYNPETLELPKGKDPFTLHHETVPFSDEHPDDPGDEP